MGGESALRKYCPEHKESKKRKRKNTFTTFWKRRCKGRPYKVAKKTYGRLYAVECKVNIPSGTKTEPSTRSLRTKENSPIHNAAISRLTHLREVVMGSVLSE